MKKQSSSSCRIFVLFAAAVLAAGCAKKESQGDDKGGSALSVLAIPAEARTFERRLTVQGTLEARIFADVAARAAGNLDELWVDEGDAVVAGKTALFQIDPVSRKNALTIAEQNLAVARASLAVAKASAEKTKAESRKANLDFERYARLHKEGKVSQNEFEAADLDRAQAQAAISVADSQVDLAERQVKQAEASLSMAQKSLDDTKIMAPISGVVSARNAEPGEHMAVGNVILRIEDVSSVEAAAFLPAQYYPDVEPGKTKFRLGVNGRDAGEHTVTYRSPTINPVLRTFEIKGRVEAAPGLAVPGNMADLTIVFEGRKGIGVPAASVLVRTGKQVVFVVKDGKAVAREVTTGFQNDGWIELLSGIEAGETVVTEGQTQLRNGMSVEIR